MGIQFGAKVTVMIVRMGRRMWMGLAAGLVALGGVSAITDTASAEGKAARTRTVETNTVEHPSTRSYRRGPQVRGFVQRRGGYSYSASDSINTYGNNGRSNYGAANSYRDPNLDRQTRFGPFDHGFFYESGVLSPWGGNSVYNH
jgi:hypothetical protein